MFVLIEFLIGVNLGRLKLILKHPVWNANEVKQALERALQQSINEVLEQALSTTGIHMKDEEKKQFIEKNLSDMALVIDVSGKISIKLNT